ncbi:MFS-type transporter SLC18B1-like [Tropilaelaps mercedesae]|uniref:MFS-type transporter SLC18B1-like n=1 Tax=Tropilaelaps mercedesae TaxID=418985 RepID=A0A1V9WZA4_9ACAR|nr:MFS-type transporter SLC18B1-like [Tropilaelaps mercedesae]
MTLQQNSSSTLKDDRTPANAVSQSSMSSSEPTPTMHEAVHEKRTFTRRELLIMIFLSFACLTEGSCFAHISPFYAEELLDRFGHVSVQAEGGEPGEGAHSGRGHQWRSQPGRLESRGNSKTQYGILFGCYPLIGVFAAPIVGKLLVNTVRAKNMLVWGMLLDAVFTILTGFLTWINGPIFFYAGLLLRALQSVGFSMACTTYYTIIGAELGPWAHVCLPIIETIYGASVVVGPAIGGFMYEHGGFKLPFFFLGGGTLITTLFVLATFPVIGGGKQTTYSWSCLLDVRIILNLLMVMSTFIIVGFNDASLAIHLRQFSLSPTMTGLAFIICGGCYSASSIFWGSMSKRVSDARFIVLCGGILTSGAVAFVGPLPFIRISTTLSLVLVMQALLGIGYGPAFVCSFMHSLAVLTTQKGLPDDLGTYAMLSGVIMPACFLGNAIGPMAGGFLLDYYGYRNATLVMFLIVLVMLLLVLASVVYDNYLHPRRHSKDSKTQEKIFTISAS